MELSAYIVAGGKSSRMGTEKGLLMINEEPFVKRIWNSLQTITTSVFIITSNKEYTNLRLNTIEDIFPDKGPVGGIHTALQHSLNENVIIISCDAPLVSAEFWQWLLQEHQKSDSEITFPTLAKKDYPLIGIYTKNLEDIFFQAIQNDLLKLRSLISQLKYNAVQVPIEFEHNLYNINTPEEYQKLLNNEDFN